MFKLYISTASGRIYIKDVETRKEAFNICLQHNMKLHPESMKMTIGNMFFLEDKKV